MMHELHIYSNPDATLLGRENWEWMGKLCYWVVADFTLFLADLPSTGGSLSVAGGKKAEASAALADADADLEERLKNLRRD